MFNATLIYTAAWGIFSLADIDYKPDFSALPFMAWLMRMVNGFAAVIMIILLAALLAAAAVIGWGHMSKRGGMEKAGMTVLVIVIFLMIVVANAGRIADWAGGQNIMGAMTPLALSLAA